MDKAIELITELANDYDNRINQSENIYERLELTQAAIAVQECLQIVVDIKNKRV